MALTEAIQKHLIACRPTALEADEATYVVANSAGETDVLKKHCFFNYLCDNDAFLLHRFVWDRQY